MLSTFTNGSHFYLEFTNYQEKSKLKNLEAHVHCMQVYMYVTPVCECNFNKLSWGGSNGDVK